MKGYKNLLMVKIESDYDFTTPDMAHIVSKTAMKIFHEHSDMPLIGEKKFANDDVRISWEIRR